MSSNHDHLIVPIFTFVVFVPPNPSITLRQSFSGTTKSSTLCNIHPEHLLSIPILNESVSNIRSRFDPMSYLLYYIASLNYIYFQYFILYFPFISFFFYFRSLCTSKSLDNSATVLQWHHKIFHIM